VCVHVVGARVHVLWVPCLMQYVGGRLLLALLQAQDEDDEGDRWTNTTLDGVAFQVRGQCLSFCTTVPLWFEFPGWTSVVCRADCVQPPFRFGVVQLEDWRRGKLVGDVWVTGDHVKANSAKSAWRVPTCVV